MPKLLPMPDPTPVDPDPEAGFGALRTSKGPLPLKALDVKVAIVGLVTRTTVSQTFVNTHREPLEAVYIFPLPPRDSVSGFTMRVGGRVVLGQLSERGAARQRYAEALREGKRAALAEEERPNVFTLSVGNLMPGDVAEITFELAGLLALEGGEAQWRFPLVVAPRYIPGTPLDVDQAGLGTSFDTDEVPDASRLNPPVLLPGYPNPVRLGLEVDWDAAGLPIEAIRSSLPTVTESVSEGRTRLRLAQAERLDRDFVLRGTFTPSAVWGTALLVPDGEGIPAGPGGSTGTLMLTLLPPDQDPARKTGRDVVFLLDHSGSMDGWKMAAARRAMARMVELLGPADRFQVVRFDSDTEVFGRGDGLLPATDANRAKAMRFLEETMAEGGTEIAPAIKEALELLGPAVPGREALVFLITDGQVGNEDRILGLLGGQGTHCRFQIIGVDAAANESLLMRLAKATRGWFLVAEHEGVLEPVLLTARRKFGTPTLTDLRLAAPQVRWLPETLVSTGGLDLYPGTPLILTARYLEAAEGAVLTLEATTEEPGGFARTYRARTLREPALRSIWARFRLRDLEDALARNPDAPGQEEAMTELSLSFGLLTRFTAWLAVDEAEALNPGGTLTTLVQPVESPWGWEREEPSSVAYCIDSAPRAFSDVSVPSVIRMTQAPVCREDAGTFDLRESEPSAPRITGSRGAPAGKAPGKGRQRTYKPERVVPLAVELLQYLKDHDFRTPTLEGLEALYGRCEAIRDLLEACPHDATAPGFLYNFCSVLIQQDREAFLDGEGHRRLLSLIQSLEQMLQNFLKVVQPKPPRKFWSLF